MIQKTKNINNKHNCCPHHDHRDTTVQDRVFLFKLDALLITRAETTEQQSAGSSTRDSLSVSAATIPSVLAIAARQRSMHSLLREPHTNRRS